MNTEVIREPYAINYPVCYDDAVTVTWTELKKAEIGKVWTIEDQDKAVNRTRTWTVSWTKVYEDETGCLIKYYDEYNEDYPEIKLIWFNYN
jgi:hypothetical protein